MARRFDILSLSGGGYFGLFTATILEKLERDAGPLAERFDLLAGTSIGGIVALALAHGVPASKIRQEFEDSGTVIFSNRASAEWILLYMYRSYS
jgi:patatin-like phospholipase/acyl hydrolase